MKLYPLILSLACLITGGVLLAFGHEATGAALIGAFLGQFAPAPHSGLRGVADSEELTTGEAE